eukprot:4102640-Pleurochrysis_carterae.AAC.1
MRAAVCVRKRAYASVRSSACDCSACTSACGRACFRARPRAFGPVGYNLRCGEHDKNETALLSSTVSHADTNFIQIALREEFSEPRCSAPCLYSTRIPGCLRSADVVHFSRALLRR